MIMKIKRLPQKYNKKLARDFGYKIKQMREECGLSQLELAQEIGLKSATAISLYESNQREIGIQKFFAICSVCGYIINLTTQH